MSGDINQWDNLAVYGAKVFITNNKLSMYYSGSNGDKSQIGYAYSLTPFQFTKEISNPIIPWNFINNTDIGIEYPSVLMETSVIGQIYNLWFNNSSTSNFYTIYYSKSTNNVDWDAPIALNFMPEGTTWDQNGRGAPTVIYDSIKNQYLMWFVTRGNYQGISRWRLGFATSSDKVNWLKSDIPALDATNLWEGSDIGNPTVIIDNGIYHMWYHGVGGIGHATSTTGTEWMKDTDNPILTAGPDWYDSQRILNPSVVKKDNIFYLYYGALGSDGKWRIALATSDPIPNATVTPTITITTTVTQIPTITPTVTPLLTPDTITILIPGLGGSWNHKDIFSCDINSSGTWAMTPFISVYDNLINTLINNAGLKLNKNFFIYNYDWRQDLDKQNDLFKKYINSILVNKSSDTKINLIGHSLGGLVIRSFVYHNPEFTQINKVITVGTPHKGSALAYPLWENGEIIQQDKWLKILTTQILNHCKLIKSAQTQKNLFLTPTEIIHTLIPSVKSLLPVFNFLVKYNDEINFNDMSEKNEWLMEHSDLNQFPTNNVLSLFGTTINTLRYITVLPPDSYDLQNGSWIDGKPISYTYSNLGDGTVLNLSSTIENYPLDYINGDHGQIISSPEAISKITSFIGFPGIKPAQNIPSEFQSNKTLTLTTGKSIKMDLKNPVNKNIARSDDIIIDFNPTMGVYKTIISPSESGESFLEILLIPAYGDTVSNNVPIQLIKNKKIEILFQLTSKNEIKILSIN